jgi:hypothetical protein
VRHGRSDNKEKQVELDLEMHRLCLAGIQAEESANRAAAEHLAMKGVRL